MPDTCKHCGACGQCERCDHCGCCRKCGKPVEAPVIFPSGPYIPQPWPCYPYPTWAGLTNENVALQISKTGN